VIFCGFDLDWFNLRFYFWIDSDIITHSLDVSNVLGKGNQIWIWQGQWLGPASFMSRCWTDVDLAFSLNALSHIYSDTVEELRLLLADVGPNFLVSILCLRFINFFKIV
jgi:hypothetical protein